MKNNLILLLIAFQCAMFYVMVMLHQQSYEHTNSAAGGGSVGTNGLRNLRASSLTSSSSTTTTSSSSSSSRSSSSSMYDLAKKQSYGFFDNISDEDWKRAQTIHTRMFPNYVNSPSSSRYNYSNTIHDKGQYKKLSDSHYWYGDNYQEEFHCAYAQRIRPTNEADGPKWVCDPHRIASQETCLVYSFGSNGKAEFEQGVYEEIGKHCEIHTFDPMSYNKRNGNFEVALRKYNATFHQWGLGTQEQSDGYKKGKVHRNFKTLQETMVELHHVNRTIDIFKIDCEWCEWETYRQWIDINPSPRQILVEVHNAPMPNVQEFFEHLHDAGYVIFSKEANWEGSGNGAEYSFLKLSTDFFQQGTTYKELLREKQENKQQRQSKTKATQ